MASPKLNSSISRAQIGDMVDTGKAIGTGDFSGDSNANLKTVLKDRQAVKTPIEDYDHSVTHQPPMKIPHSNDSIYSTVPSDEDK